MGIKIQLGSRWSDDSISKFFIYICLMFPPPPTPTPGTVKI